MENQVCVGPILGCIRGLALVDQVYGPYGPRHGGVCITSKPEWRIVLETQTLSSWSLLSFISRRVLLLSCRVVGFIIFCVAPGTSSPSPPDLLVSHRAICGSECFVSATSGSHCIAYLLQYST